MLKKFLKKSVVKIFKNYKVNKITRSNENVRISIGNEHLDYDHIMS